MMMLAVCFLAPLFLCAQSNWELKKNEDGIRVYTKSSDESRHKGVKVTCELDGSLSELAALLLDASAHPHWVFNTKESYVVKQVSPYKQIYYSEIKLPWPLTNREVVVEMTLRQDPKTKALMVTTDAINSDIPGKKGMVRVVNSSVKWNVTALPGEKLNVEYVGQADPGGSVPAWITNMFSTKGPLETFRRLKKLIASNAYEAASHSFIVD
jgi:hypothetical protein